MYGPLIHNLAPETLSEIFQFVCPIFNFPEIVRDYEKIGCDDGGPHPERPGVHFALAAVCSRWRYIVSSTPRLWTNLYIDIDGKRFARSMDSYTKYFDLHIHNSGVLPLSAEVILPDKCTWTVKEKAWGSTLLEGLQSRVQSLVLFNPRKSLLVRLSHSMPSLRNLALFVSPDAVIDGPSRLNITKAPHLDNLILQALESWAEFDLELLWTSIKHLDLVEVSPRNCVKALRLCQGLIQFSAYSRFFRRLLPGDIEDEDEGEGEGEDEGGGSEGEDESESEGEDEGEGEGESEGEDEDEGEVEDENEDEGASPVPPSQELQHYKDNFLELPNLKSFEWPTYQGEPIDAFLTHIYMPVLETLELHYARPFSRVTWETFFLNAPKSLRKLELYDFYPATEAGELDLPEWFFCKAPQVEELALHSCHWVFLNTVLEALGLQQGNNGDVGRSESEGNDEGVTCPKFLAELRTVRISSPAFQEDDAKRHCEEVRERLADMAEKRFRGFEEVPRVMIREDKEENEIILDLVRN